jgi:hypothetical protein
MTTIDDDAVIDDQLNQFNDYELVCHNKNTTFSDNCYKSGWYCDDIQLNATCKYHFEGPCPKGYYCPDSRSFYKCERGYFCPWGTTDAIKCSWSRASCPKIGMSSPRNGNMFVLFAFLILVFVYAVKKLGELMIIRRQNEMKRKTTLQRQTYGQEQEALITQKHLKYDEYLLLSYIEN